MLAIIVFCAGMLVNRLSISRSAIKYLEQNLLTSLPNENESWTVYSFSAKGFNSFKNLKNLAKPYIGVSMADRIGR